MSFSIIVETLKYPPHTCARQQASMSFHEEPVSWFQLELGIRMHLHIRHKFPQMMGKTVQYRLKIVIWGDLNRNAL